MVRLYESRGRERVCRLVAALFFLGALVMTLAALANESPPMLLSAILQGVAWFCFVALANRIEATRKAGETEASGPAERG